MMINFIYLFVVCQNLCVLIVRFLFRTWFHELWRNGVIHYAIWK